MDLNLFFTSELTYELDECPDTTPLSDTVGRYVKKQTVATLGGVKTQFDRIPGRYGVIHYWKQTSTGQFCFERFPVDKQTMYFEKVSYDVFKQSFIEARPAIKQELASSMLRSDLEAELDAVLLEEYADSYELYTHEIFSFNNESDSCHQIFKS